MTHKRISIVPLVAIGCLLFTATLSPAAKQSPTRETRPMARLDGILEGLELTPDQKQQVDAIRQSAIETLRPRELKDLPPEERRQKLQQQLATIREQLKSVLTPQQMEKLGAGLRESVGQRFNALEVPATQPNGASGGANPATTRGPMVQRLGEQLNKLDLSAEQKLKADGLLDALAGKINKLRADAKAGGAAADVRQEVQTLMQGFRSDLTSILTPQQRQKLGELMPGARRSAGADPPTMNAAPPGPTTNPSPTNPSNAAATKVVAASLPASLEIGSRAPDFSARRLNGGTVLLKSFAGKPLVLVFGSYTSPTFRDLIPKLSAIQKEYNWRANFLIIYTREAHARGEWEVDRNNDENIRIDQPQTITDRIRLATNARDVLGITIDMAIDDMDASIAQAYAAGSGGAIVVSPTGLIVGTQKWCDPSGLRPMIDAALKAKK